MGKSRSATILIAYLLSTRPDLTPQTALELIRQVRPFVEPNTGFMSQLGLYHQMSCPVDLDSEPQYQQWCYKRAVDESLSIGRAPKAEDLLFPDETMSISSSNPKLRSEADTSTTSTSTLPPEPSSKILTTYRCRRCRRHLATSHYVLPHTPRAQSSSKTYTKPKDTIRPQASHECAHIFLDQPLSWMRPEIEQGKLEGRLECAKCQALVGRYAWQGMKCSCGEWVVPGISLGVTKVDAMKVPVTDSAVEEDIPNEATSAADVTRS